MQGAQLLQVHAHCAPMPPMMQLHTMMGSWWSIVLNHEVEPDIFIAFSALKFDAEPKLQAQARGAAVLIYPLT